VVKVLLNATEAEVGRIGGDFTHYRDLQRLSNDRLQMRMVPDGMGRRLRGLGGRVAEHACRIWEPAALRRRLFLSGRAATIYPGDLRRTGADIVFSHLWIPLLADGCRLPTVWSSEGISPAAYYAYVNGNRWSLEDVVDLYRTAARPVSALVIFTARCASNLVAACPELEERVYVIHPPVDTPGGAVAPKPSLVDGVIRLLFVGADARRKGLPEALAAYRALPAGASRCRFTVVSRPPPDLLGELQATPGVRFIPTAPAVDVGQLMAESDILVIPTRADTYAKVAVEAMAAGCAVVITDMDPLPEVVPDGQTGFSVPIGDHAELVRKLATLVENDEVLRGMQVEARRLHLRRNAPGVVRGQIEEMVEEVLRHSPALRSGAR
jgi:glycosyltransferase involved in cell wall biosynthesis